MYSLRSHESNDVQNHCGTYKIDDNLLTIVHNLFVQVFSHCNDLYSVHNRSNPVGKATETVGSTKLRKVE